VEVTTAKPGERDTGISTNQRRIGGRYVLHATIGAGGMGTVWRARDELLRRDVAVKEVLLPPGLPAAERDMLCERTLREARSAAALNHPAVIRVFDVVDDDSRPWIVMELLDARSLADVIREDGPLPPRAVAAIGLAVLGALEAAHTAGVLHRDIKPGNVMVAADGRTTLTDFGVASAPGDSSLTSTGLLLGSPQYIAPERARGQAFGPSSDLFSLGATLYAAVQGKPPFDRGDPLPTLTAVVGEDPDPMTLAGPLVPVLTGLLTKSPNDRFTHAKARAGLLSILGAGLDSDTDSDAARRAALVAQTVQHTPAPLPGRQPSTGEVAAAAPGSVPAPELAGDATMWMPLPTAAVGAPPNDEETVTEPAASTSDPGLALLDEVAEPEPARHGAHEPGTHAAGSHILGERPPDSQLPIAVSPGPIDAASVADSSVPTAAEASPPSGPPAVETPVVQPAADTSAPPVVYDPAAAAAVAPMTAPALPSSPVSAGQVSAAQVSGGQVSAGQVSPAQPVAGATTAMPAWPAATAPPASPQAYQYDNQTRAMPAQPPSFSYGVAATPAPQAPQPYQQPQYQQPQYQQQPYQAPPTAAYPGSVSPAPPTSPPTSPPPLPDAAPPMPPRQPRNKQLLLIGVVAAVVVVVIGIVGVLVGISLGNRPAPSTANSTAPVSLTLYRHQSGFQIQVPTGWTSQGTNQVRFYDTGKKVWIQLYTEKTGAGGQRQVWESGSRRQERGLAGGTDYQLIGYSTGKMGKYAASDWEWSYQRNGETERRHTLYRGVVIGGLSYQLALSAPESQFAKRRALLDQVSATFQLS
jgi:hypothetical protein